MGPFGTWQGLGWIPNRGIWRVSRVEEGKNSKRKKRKRKRKEKEKEKEKRTFQGSPITMCKPHACQLFWIRQELPMSFRCHRSSLLLLHKYDVEHLRSTPRPLVLRRVQPNNPLPTDDRESNLTSGVDGLKRSKSLIPPRCYRDASAGTIL